MKTPRLQKPVLALEAEEEKLLLWAARRIRQRQQRQHQQQQPAAAAPRPAAAEADETEQAAARARSRRTQQAGRRGVGPLRARWQANAEG